MKRISTSIVVLTVLLLFTGVDFAGTPVALNAQSESELVNQTLDAAGQPAYTGTGAARTATLKGLVTNTSAGPLVIDSATTGYAKMTVPSGWTGTYVRSDINSMSMWSSDALNNGKLRRIP